MDEIIWNCPVCKFGAITEEDRQNHLEETINDPSHFRYIAQELEEEEKRLF